MGNPLDQSKRKEVIERRKKLFGGGGSNIFEPGGDDYSNKAIDLDRIIYTNPATDEVWTWEDVLLADSALKERDGLGFDPTDTPLPPDLSWAEWYNGGYREPIIGVLDFMPKPDMEEEEIGRGARGRRAPEPPIFRPEDEAAIREQVRNYVVATTGTANEVLINRAVIVFKDRNREAFDSAVAGGSKVDPWQAVKESVRESAVYRAVHGQRPDSVDELEWVTGRQAKLRQLGLSAVRAESAGVDAAISGSTDEALTGQARIAQVEGTGRLLQAHRESLKQSANAALGLV